MKPRNGTVEELAAEVLVGTSVAVCWFVRSEAGETGLFCTPQSSEPPMLKFWSHLASDLRNGVRFTKAKMSGVLLKSWNEFLGPSNGPTAYSSRPSSTSPQAMAPIWRLPWKLTL